MALPKTKRELAMRASVALPLAGVVAAMLWACTPEEPKEAEPTEQTMTESTPATPLASAAQTPLQRGMAFLAENGKRANVVTTSSGLQYEVLASGTGDQPGAEDYVSTHYHGTFIGGDVFDSSVQRGQPIEFRVNGVIKGWQEALQLMSVGDKWKLYIPSDLAYGANGTTGIGPDETLIFEVELLGVRRS